MNHCMDRMHTFLLDCLGRVLLQYALHTKTLTPPVSDTEHRFEKCNGNTPVLRHVSDSRFRPRALCENICQIPASRWFVGPLKIMFCWFLSKCEAFTCKSIDKAFTKLRSGNPFQFLEPERLIRNKSVRDSKKMRTSTHNSGTPPKANSSLHNDSP